MRSILRRRAAVTLSALALGTGLTACGGSTGTTHTGAPVWPGVGGTAPAAPAAAGGTSPSRAPAKGSPVDAATIAAKLRRATAATTSAHVVMSMEAAGARVGVVGDVTTRPVAENLTMSVMGMSMDMRFVGDTFYIRPPASAGLGGKWVKATTAEIAAASGIGGLTSMTDPLATLKISLGAIRSARYLGTDAIGQHYVIKQDTGKVLRSLGISSDRLGQLSAMMPPIASENIWFDGAGHVVRSSTDLGQGGADTVRLSRFGERVVVTPPPADQVVDMGSLGGLGGLGNL